MGQSGTHNINIVWSNTGLDTVTSASNNFAKTSTTVAKSQDQVSTALTKTQGAAVKTGKEYTNVAKASTNTAKTTGTLGKAFKGSSLQVSAFASSLTSSYIQIDSLMDQQMKLSGMRARLDKQTTTLTIAEGNLEKKWKAQKLTAEEYRLQSEKLANQRAVLAVKEDQYADAVQDNTTAWVALATTVLPTVMTGFSSLSQIIGSIRTTQQATKASTDVLATATTGLGTAATTTGTKGITPLITGLKNFVLGSKDTTTVLGTKTNGLVGGFNALNLGFTDSEKSGNIFIRTFKNIGSSIKGFFSNMKTDITASTGIVDKIKAGFTSFFTQIGTGFKGLGGHLKTAGAAFVTFGKAVTGVFMSNPILFAITAIATALAALIFDLGGFRTKLNEIGVALGQMVPGLKPLLDGLGWLGQQLGNVGNMLMGTQKELENTAKSVAYLTKTTDPAVVALKKVTDIGNDVKKLEALSKQFDVIRQAISHLGDAGQKYSTQWQKEFDAVKNSVQVVFDSVKVKSKEFIASFNAIQKTLKLYKDGTIEAEDAQKLLTGQLDVFNSSAGATVQKTKQMVQVENEAAAATKKLSGGMTEAERIIKTYNSTTADSERVFKDFAIALVEGNYDIIQSMLEEGVEIEALMDRFKKEFPEGAVVVEQSGQKVIKSVQDIKKEAETATADMGKFFEDVSKTITENLPPSLATVQQKIRDVGLEEQYMADVSKLAAAGIVNDKKAWADEVVKLAKKYPELNKGTQIVEDITAATEKHKEEQEKAAEATNKMITAEEKAKKVTEEWKTSMDAIAQSFQNFGSKGTSQLQSVGQKLLDIADKARAASDEFITGEGKRKERKEKFHETMMQLYDEETKAIGNMDIAVARQSHVWAEWSTMATESVNNFAASALVGEFPAAITAIETALDQTPEQWKGASGQLDAILNDTALNSRDKANLIASDMGMLENAMKPVQVGAEYVGKAGAEAAAGLDELANAALQNVNPLTQMDDAWKTFTSSLTPAQKELGLVQAVMKKVEGGTMTAAKGFQILGQAGITASEQIGKTVTTSLQTLEHQIIKLGDGTSTTVAKMDGQWVNLGNSAATNLGPGGAQGQVQNLEGTLTGLGTTATTELGSTVPGAMSTASTTANTQFNQIVNYANLVIEVFKALSTYAQTYIAGGIKTAIDAAVASVSQMSTNIATYMTAMTTAIGEWIKASTTSMGAFASGPIKVVQGALSTLSTSVSTYMKSMDAAITGFAKKAGTSLGQVGTAATGAQGKLSTMSTSVATYMSSMTKNVASFASKFSSSMKTVGSQADAAAKKVAALKKGIDALKSKTITITVNARGSGLSYIRHGGSAINIPSETGVSYAAGGKTWLQKTPRKLGNTHVAETFPELISAIPLDPREKNSPFNKKNIQMDVPVPSIPRMMASGGGGGGGGARQPINVELHTTVAMPDGRVLAKAVQQHLLEGFSGIT